VGVTEVLEQGGREPVWHAWRDGNQLVLGPDAQLPDRCVKTDLPAAGNTVDIVAMWHEPALYWLIVLNIIVYLIVVRAVGTRVEVTVGAIPAAAKASRREWFLTLALGGGGVLAWVAAAALETLPLVWLGLALMLLAIPVYLMGARFVRVARLDGELVWLRGVHPAHLARLPELPK